MHTWTIGDKCYIIHCTIGGRAWDCGSQPQPDRETAIADARAWYGSLSARERKQADCWVREYIVSGLDDREEDDDPDDDESTNIVGAAASTAAHVWCLDDDDDHEQDPD